MNGVKMFMKPYENSYNSDPIHIASNYSFPKNCDMVRHIRIPIQLHKSLGLNFELILCFLIIANHIRVLEYLDYIGQLIDISMSTNQIQLYNKKVNKTFAYLHLKLIKCHDQAVFKCVPIICRSIEVKTEIFFEIKVPK